MCTHHKTSSDCEKIWRSPQSVFQTPSKTNLPKRNVTCSKKWRKHSYVAIFLAVSNRESCSSSVKVEAHLVIKNLCQGSKWALRLQWRVCWMWKHMSMMQVSILMLWIIQVVLTRGSQRSPWPQRHSPRSTRRRWGQSQLGPGCGGECSSFFSAENLQRVQQGHRATF